MNKLYKNKTPITAVEQIKQHFDKAVAEHATHIQINSEKSAYYFDVHTQKHIAMDKSQCYDILNNKVVAVADVDFNAVETPVSEVVADVSIEPTETITPQTEPIASVEQATVEQVAEVVEESKEVEPTIDFEQKCNELTAELDSKQAELDKYVADFAEQLKNQAAELELARQKLCEYKARLYRLETVFERIKDKEITVKVSELKGE